MKQYLALLILMTIAYTGTTLLGSQYPELMAAITTCISLMGVIWIATDYYKCCQHPLNEKISSKLHIWHQGLPFYYRWYLLAKPFQLIINLSLHPIEHELSGTLQSAFSLRYKECRLNGYYQPHGPMCLEIYHPHTDHQQIRRLCQELARTGIKFKCLHIAIDPEQLDSIQEKIHAEWVFLWQFIDSAQKVHISLNTSDLNNNFYYVSEYSTLEALAINVNSQWSQNVLRHYISHQYDILLQKLFNQCNELCLAPPIDPIQKKKILGLPLYLANLKDPILNFSELFISHGRQLEKINFGFQLGDPPQYVIRSLNIKTYLTRASAWLTLILLALLAVQFVSQKHLSKKLDGLGLHESISIILKLDKANIGRYMITQKASSFFFETIHSLSPQQQALYPFILKQHRIHPFPAGYAQWLVHKILSLDLGEEESLFFIDTWSKHLSNDDIRYTEELQSYPFSDLIQELPDTYPDYSCLMIQQMNHPSMPEHCVQHIQQQQALLHHEKTLDGLIQTIIPVNMEQPEQIQLQLSYLIKHPKYIGHEALHKLDSLYNQTKTLPNNQSVIQSIKELKSLIELLQSNQGVFLLQLIQKLYLLYDQITDPIEAHHLLQTVYSLSDHPIRILIDSKNTLTPTHARWMHSMIDPPLQSIIKQATQHIYSGWDELVYQPLTSLIQNQFPFNPHAQLETTSSDFYNLFGPNQQLDQFYHQYLSTYVEETENGLEWIPIDLHLPIPPSVLITMMYTQIIQSSISFGNMQDIHGSWAISLTHAPHNVNHVYLISSRQKTMLNIRKGEVLHWASDTPIGFEIELNSGETINLIREDTWGMMRLFSLFNQKQGQKPQYTYTDPGHAWHITLELTPQAPIDLLTPELLSHVPLDEWTFRID